MAEYLYHHKTEMKRINIKELNLETPDLKNSEESKATIISKWMADWIDKNISKNIIQPNMLMPTKAEFAYFLGVSIGTIQNALRALEDMGYVESKQRIGTIIRDKSSSDLGVRKLTSKREQAISRIKNFIHSNKMKKGSILPSSRAIAELISCSSNTTRLALEYLNNEGVIIKNNTESSDIGWIVQNPNLCSSEDENLIEQKTLVLKIEKELKDYISKELSVGEKLPAHSKLASKFKVSIKTIHDALKSLIDEGIILARRGRYGTTVISLPNKKHLSEGIETSIFAPAKETAFYYYEKTQNSIKRMIAENYDIGSKLPSIMELSKAMDLSPNTIRKAFLNLAKEGYLTFSRGRYGGTFVTNIPESGEEAFKWIAVNPQYTRVYSSN